MDRETVAVTLDAETYDRIAAREGSEAAAHEWIRETLERRLAVEATEGERSTPAEFVDDSGL